MKKIRIFLLLSTVILCSSILSGQNFVSINGTNPGIQASKNTLIYFTADPCAELDLGYDFTDYTFDWYEGTGAFGTDWYSYNETCTPYGGSATFIFYTNNPSNYPYYRHVILSFQPWWGSFWGGMMVDIV